MASSSLLQLQPASTATEIEAFFSTHEPAVTITRADSPADVRSILETESVDCLVTEWALPETDPASFLESVRSLSPTLPIICFTAHDSAIAAEAFAHGVTDYVHNQGTAGDYAVLATRVRSALTSSTVHRGETANSTAKPRSAALQSESEPTPTSSGANEPTAAQHLAENVVERGQFGVIVFDTAGCITLVNPCAERLLERSASELIGGNCERLEMVTPDGIDLPLADRPVAHVLATGESVLDQTIGVTVGTDEKRWFSITASPLTDGSPTDGVVVTLTDISAEVELETTLETVFERMTDGFVSFNTDLELTYFSDKALNTERYPDETYLGDTLAGLHPSLAQYEPLLREVLDEQEPRTVETYVPEPTSGWVRARLYPSSTGVSVFFQDITDEKESQRQLEQYRTIVESVKDGVCILDSSLEFVYVNEALADLVGYAADDLIGRPAACVSDEGDLRTVDTYRTELADGERDVGVLSGEITSKSGRRIPVESQITPIDLATGEQGTVGIVRDRSFRKRTEATYTALYKAAHTLLSVHTDDEIAEIGVETVGSVFSDFPDVIVFRYDVETNSFEPLAHSPSAESNFPGMPSISVSESSLASRVFFENRVVATDDMSELSGLYDPDTPYGRALFSPIGGYGVLFMGEPAIGEVDEHTRTVGELIAATLEAAFSRLASEQQSKAHRQQLAEQTDELHQLTRLNSLVRDLGNTLFQATTREEIEASVCSILTQSERYRFAWIGEPNSRTDSLRVRAFDGAEQGYLDSLPELRDSAVSDTAPTAAVGVDTDGSGVDHASPSGDIDAEDGHLADAEATMEPTWRAARESSVVSIAEIARDWEAAPWRTRALSRGFQSVLSIPLQYHDISYGVLSIYADRTVGFDDYAQTVLAEFGEIIGYVIATTETKQGLLTDRLVELTLEFRDPTDCLHRLASSIDRPVSFEGFVPQSGGRSLVYISVEERTSAHIEQAAEQISAIRSFRVVSEGESTVLCAFQTDGPLLATTLVNCGVIPQWIEADGAVEQAMVTVPQTTAIRSVLDRLRETYPGVELLGRHERDYGVQTRETFHATLTDRLTDRQQDALWAAYLGRYFESPRGSTGTQIGESLGITQPTFNHHLRGALRTLLGMVFAETQGQTLDT